MSSNKFVFVGGTSTRSHEVEWSVEVQALCVRRWLDGVKAKDIFVEALSVLNESRTTSGLAPIVELPKSYTKYAASLLWGIRTRFGQRMTKNDKATLEAAAKFNIEIEKVGDAQ